MIKIVDREAFVKLMLKLENRAEDVTESEKHACVCDILEQRLGVELSEDDPMVRKISDRVGSMWVDLPMPVAATDIPDSIEMFYHEVNGDC